EPALVADPILGPQSPEDRDALLEPGSAVGQLHPERRELGLGLLARQASADAGTEDHPAARHVIERGPLGGEEQRVSQRERRETAGSEPHLAGARGDRREQHEGLEARLGEEAVADPDRIDRARRVGLFGIASSSSALVAPNSTPRLGRLSPYRAGRDGFMRAGGGPSSPAP